MVGGTIVFSKHNFQLDYCSLNEYQFPIKMHITGNMTCNKPSDTGRTV